MQFRKLSAFAVTGSFILFTFGAQPIKAVPTSEELRNGDESWRESDPSDSHAGEVVETSQAPAKAKAAPKASAGNKKHNTSHKEPRNLANNTKAKKRGGHKSRREPYASVAARRLYIMKRKYILRTHRPFVITSFGRGPARQARAIRRNLQAYGTRYVLRQYRGSMLIREILLAYKANSRNSRQAEKQMAAVIRNQIARGQYVSQHLRGQAVDVRSHGRGAARLSVLRQVAHEVGAQVSVERDHYHVNLV
ncbi:MAG: hypothetical protein JOZ02_00750 [Acidobacteria bacterium]|nr:hypothetical protein [Acidobacteriota bacterium]